MIHISELQIGKRYKNINNERVFEVKSITNVLTAIFEDNGNCLQIAIGGKSTKEIITGNKDLNYIEL